MAIMRTARPTCGTYGMCLPLLLNSVSLLLGEAKEIRPIIPMYVLTVVNDILCSRSKQLASDAGKRYGGAA
ncbi:hypothetical protein V1279_001953 [Bradyrhizobium sp. AZCC 1610]